MTQTIVPVELGDRSYPIIIENSFDTLPAALDEHVNADRYYIVTDQNVAELYLPPLQNLLAVKDNHVFIINAGENSKNIDTYAGLCSFFLNNGITRRDAIIALGGGVVGDLAGFASATIMRGVKYVQIPTTLLAQVDSSVGGKTGINTPSGKNLIGSFYQPQLVYSNLETLMTLPPRQMHAGYAEILKYALINDVDFFEWLDKNAGILLSGDNDALSRAIAVSCHKKAEIVAADERESGMRALLNLGHTFGHALEAIAGYDGSLLHGEAVLIGMDMALAYSVEKGYADETHLIKLRAHYKQYSLRPAWPLKASLDEIFSHMQKDKKNIHSHIVLILMRGIGETFISKQESSDNIKDFLARYLKAR